MTPRRFAWLLAARGSDLATWSPADRTAALVLMRADPGIRTLLADSLATEDPADLSDEALSRDAPDSAALLRMRSRVRRALAPPPPVLRGIRAGALAACIAVGLYFGLNPVEADTASLAAAGFASSVDGSVSATVLAALDP